MRIGVVGRVEPDMFGANLIEAVRDAGHEAVPLGPAAVSHRLKVMKGMAELSRQALPRLEQTCWSLDFHLRLLLDLLQRRRVREPPLSVRNSIQN